MKLNPKLFKVRIRIAKDDLKKVSALLSHPSEIIETTDQTIDLLILEMELKKIDQSDIDYHIQSLHGLKAMMKYSVLHFSLLIGIMLFIGIIYTNTTTIKGIDFSTYTKDNDRIVEVIETNLYEINDLKFLKTSISTINLQLRKEFSSFEWISVKQEGCILHVTILQPSIINKQIEFIDGSGDLVAKSDGVIQYFQISHGLPIISINQVVHKGDVLVSGNLRLNQEDEIFYIPASGKVFAEVWYTKTVSVPKESLKTEYTGKIKTEKQLIFFGLSFTIKSASDLYENYDTEETIHKWNLFQLSLPFGTKKIHYLEKNDIMRVYDQDSSYRYAYSSMEYYFLRQLNDDEKIESIQCVLKEEDETNFTYTFFISTYENIAEFQRRTE